MTISHLLSDVTSTEESIKHLWECVSAAVEATYLEGIVFIDFPPDLVDKPFSGLISLAEQDGQPLQPRANKSVARVDESCLEMIVESLVRCATIEVESCMTDATFCLDCEICGGIMCDPVTMSDGATVCRHGCLEKYVKEIYSGADACGFGASVNVLSNKISNVCLSPEGRRSVETRKAAENLWKEGKLGEAEEAYAKALVESNQDAGIYASRSRFWIIQSKDQLALEDAEKAIYLVRSCFTLRAYRSGKLEY